MESKKKNRIALFQLDVGDWILCSEGTPYVITSKGKGNTTIKSPRHGIIYTAHNHAMYTQYSPSKEEELSILVHTFGS